MLFISFLLVSYLFSVFIVSVSREELNGIIPSWGLGSPRLCVAVGLIGVMGGRGLFIVWHEEVLQKTGDCRGRARLGNSLKKAYLVDTRLMKKQFERNTTKQSVEVCWLFPVWQYVQTAVLLVLLNIQTCIAFLPDA